MKYADHTIVVETPKLHAELVAAIDAFKPRNVLETGTYLGTGTTQAILNALGGNCVDKFVTIEANIDSALKARARLGIKGVKVVNGLSVLYEQGKQAVNDPWLFKPPDGVSRDHEFPSDYLYEIGYYHCGYTPTGGPWILHDDAPRLDGLLAMLTPLARPLICLDSCGALGWLEFSEVCRLQPAPFLLFLDDVNHVKHYRSRLAIEADPEHWKVHAISVDGWMIAERIA